MVVVSSGEAPSEVLVRLGEVLPATCVLADAREIIRSHFLMGTSIA